MSLIKRFTLLFATIPIISCSVTYPEGKPYRNFEYDFITHHFGPTFSLTTFDIKRYRRANIERVMAFYESERMEFVRVYDAHWGSTTIMTRAEFDYLVHDIHKAFFDLHENNGNFNTNFVVINQKGVLLVLRKYPEPSEFQFLDDGRRYFYPTDELVKLFVGMAMRN